jgi:hypothetical protein
MWNPLARWFKKPEPVTITFKYHWMQVNTRRRGIKTIDCNTRQEFLELLAKWNRMDPERWKYWEV